MHAFIMINKNNISAKAFGKLESEISFFFYLRRSNMVYYILHLFSAVRTGFQFVKKDKILREVTRTLQLFKFKTIMIFPDF